MYNMYYLYILHHSHISSSNALCELQAQHVLNRHLVTGHGDSSPRVQRSHWISCHATWPTTLIEWAILAIESWLLA